MTDLKEWHDTVLVPALDELACAKNDAIAARLAAQDTHDALRIVHAENERLRELIDTHRRIVQHHYGPVQREMDVQLWAASKRTTEGTD